ncbi:MAG TPA: hypothetical protein VGG17_06775 [Acidimicrobiales bacterium]|jgi:hypothetical protein
MSELFAEPDADHSPAVYWFWHRLPTSKEIDDQIHEMYSGGIKSFQIQARLAYPIEDYMDSAYLSACRLAVETAARLGMTVGIYDEYNWQSGMAGGRTVHGADELRERHVFWAEADRSTPGIATSTIDHIESSTASLGDAGMAWQYDGGVVQWTEWEIVSVLAYPRTEIKSVDDVHDLTESSRIISATQDDCVVETAIPENLQDMKVVTFVSGRCATSRVPNYLLKATAERFIEVGYEPFFEAFGDYFGSTVTYFFFDQPHATFYSWPQHFGNLRSSLPYASKLRDFLEAATGKDFSHLLLSTIEHIGPDTSAMRTSFYEHYTELVFQNYLQTLSEWTVAHGVALSGHEVLGHVGSWHPSRAFSDWDLRVNFGLDYFGVDQFRGITGIDAQDCVPQLSPKLGDSVARSNGRSGCIVELYIAGKDHGPGAFAGAWGLTLEDLRAQAIRLEILGARQFLYHGFYQTDGNDHDFTKFANPRFDFPPGINFEPWWPFYRPFADEAARLSVFVDEAEPSCEVAIFYPRRTAWMEGPSHNYGDHIEFWASYLAERGYGFHFIDERDLLKATIDAGELCVDRRRYRALVLPSVTTLESIDSVNVLASFVEGSGILIATGSVPTHLQHGRSEDTARAWHDTVENRPSYHRSVGVPDDEFVAPILLPLMDYRPHAVPADGQPLWQWSGRDEHGSRLAIFNDQSVPRTITVRLPSSDVAFEQWNATSGLRDDTLHIDRSSDESISFLLDAMKLVCVRIGESTVDQPRGTPPRAAAARTTNDQFSVITLDSDWTLELPSGSGKRFPVSVLEGWEGQGFPGFSGVGTYSSHFDSPSGEGPILLALPVVNTAVEVRVNDVLVGSRAWAPYEFVIDRNLLSDESNELELRIYSSAGNKYYGGTPFQDEPEPSGLGGAPTIRYLDLAGA